MNPTVVNPLKTALKLAVSAGALYVVFRRIDAPALAQTLAHANGLWLGVALSLFVGSKLLSAARLRVLFGSAGVLLTAPFNRRLYWLGMFYNLFLPGGIGGDAYKVYYLSRQTGAGVRPLLTATLLDRLIGLLPVVSLTLLLAAGLALVPNWLAALGVVAIHGGAAVALRWWLPHYVCVLPRATWLSAGVQLAQCASVWALVQALGAPGHWVAYQLVFLVSSVVAALPLTVGGAGARELVFLTGAPYLGLPTDAAVAISLLFYGVTALVSLAGGYYSWNPSTLQRTYPT